MPDAIGYIHDVIIASLIINDIVQNVVRLLSRYLFANLCTQPLPTAIYDFFLFQLHSLFLTKPLPQKRFAS